MLVGPTGGGKSRNLHVLEDTLGQLKVLGEQGFAYEKVKIYQLNPKSITMGTDSVLKLNFNVDVEPRRPDVRRVRPEHARVAGRHHEHDVPARGRVHDQ